ncbi:MAG TPA: FAD-linked oxidase C-terminal domain-containing protein [Myxococcales bacterium]|jgi:glycolate oxidase|nr:FAD-linked oxidase C-terminal domain-containing protein [Myxococcales bacterium]
MPDSPTPATTVEAEEARAAAAVAASGAQAHAALAGTPHTGGAFVGVPAQLAERVRAIVGASNCITEKQELRTYECDGLTSFRVTPGMVVLPISTDEVVRVVKLVHAAGLPIVPRGSGTGLSGGALPVPGCVLLGLSRMKRILEIDLENGWMRVEPGVINLDVSKKLSPAGYYYAPDPSSQSVCSIGGNVAENSGGAHCLKYGFTVNHVLGAKVVLPDGAVVELGGAVLDTPGYDLTGILVGSEGTLGIVTEVTLRVLRKPEATRTFFATFPSTDEAGNAVSKIIAAGIVPAAIEMMDRLAIKAIKAATGVDWPDVGAALLMDVDGPVAEVEHTARAAVKLAEEAGALQVRLPKDEQERAVMWKGRKSAFAAVGRISPNYVVQDGVIPRSEISKVLREIEIMTKDAGLRCANVFHAGDGNLHPLVLYNARIPGQEARAEKLAGDILKLCVKAGGSITGEHGVGAEKAPYMNDMFTDADLATMSMLRCAFDPEGRMNPGKVFPTPRLCGDKPGVYHPHDTELTGQAGRG